MALLREGNSRTADDSDMIGEKDILLKKQAIEKATKEYRKYQVQNLSPVEEEYLASIKNIQSIVKKKEIIDKTE